MEHLTYNYDLVLVITAVLTSLIGTYTSVTIIQSIRYCHTLKSMLILLTISSISLSVQSVWATHSLMVYSMSFENEVYLRIDYTFISLFASSVSNMIGFYLSFLFYHKRVIKDYECSLHGVDEGKDRESIDFMVMFRKTKLNRKDYGLILAGAIFIGPSIFLLHMVGMYALRLHGEIDFTFSIQLVIALSGVVVSVVVNLAFYLRDSAAMRIVLTAIISGTIIAIHCISVHNIDFLTDPAHDYSGLSSDSSLMSVTLTSKIVLGCSSFLAYVFNEVSNSIMRNSWRIVKDLGSYMEFGNTNYLFIKKYISQYRQDNETMMKSIKLEKDRGGQSLKRLRRRSSCEFQRLKLQNVIINVNNKV
jgi:NO-binding membrane sensor protein with MHYT domain